MQMELMTKLIVNPLLWIVYISLPLLSGPLTSPPLLRRPDPSSTFVVVCKLLAWCCAWLLFIMLLSSWIEPAYFVPFIPFLSIFLNEYVKPRMILPSPLSAVDFPLALGCTVYIAHVGIFAWAKATTHFFIFGLKNRRACQLLSALAAMVIGLTKAAIFAAIPVSLGMLLTIPDLDPNPWLQFKVRFAEFLTAHMDEESLHALLYSKFFKMLSCNEMMPSLPGHIQSSAGAWFVRDGRTSSQQGVLLGSNVEPEYRIGLGSITTLVRQNQMDVGVFTPFAGAKNMTIKNTPRSRYNLDKSARFWRENPEMGIWNKEKLLAMDLAEVKIYCISVDDWIKFCGSDDYIFEERVSDQVL